MIATDSYTDIVDAPECTSLREGQRVFERYVLEEMAGRGCMGTVWKARDKTLDRIVALKFLPERLYRDAAARDALKRETRQSLDLAHPNIVRIYDFLEDGDMAAIAMEYVDGLNLSELRMERPSRCFKPEELSVWVTELCAAIDYAHETGRCLHRDLKPDSLMVNSLGVLKITDFGFGSSTRGQADGATLGYMSPQQVMGEPPSPSDDIYAVGATLYELLTGKPPLYGDDLITQIGEVIPESMAARRRNSGLPESTLPAAWEDAVAACLAKDPHWRPASGHEIAFRLGLTVQAPAEATSSTVEKSASILKWLKDPRLTDALSRVTRQVRIRMGQLARQTRISTSQSARQVRIWTAQLKVVPWKHYRWQMISGAAILCAILPWLVRTQPLSAPPVVAAAPAVESAPASVPAVVASAPAPAPTPASPAAPIAPAASATAVTTAPPAAPVVASPSPAPVEAPAIPNVPPLTADQRALTEPIPASEAGAQVRIETVPPGIAFQVTSDSPDASARPEVQGSGVSPATLILPKGAYRIVYSLPGQAPRMTSVKVPAAGSTLFQQEFPHGVVKVHCQPDRAEVICDGRSVGAAPVDLLLPPGRHEIGARWNGRQARTKTVELADAGEQTLAFEFPASSSSSTARSHHSKKKQDNSLFAKIGRGFKNLFDGDSDKKR
jgi:serine/threonine protein kinase